MAELALCGGSAVAAELRTAIPPWPQFDASDREALCRVLEGRRWCRIYSGSWTEKFEEAFASYHDAQHCIAVANGTVSLELALKCCGIRAGDEVLVPAVTFIATASAVTEVGATPIFVDIDPTTATVSPEAVEAAVTSRTRALIAVHYAGYPCDFDRLLPICQRHGLALIEDAAHAQGTEWKGRKVGACGTIGSFSFQETKSLASGEGGAITTDQEELAEKARLIHNIGRVVGRPGYDHFVLSSNYRLSEFQGALLLSQLQKLPEWTRVKHENGRWLSQQFREIGGLEPLREDERITTRGYYFYVLRYHAEAFKGLTRDKFVEAWNAEGVPAHIAYGYPLYRNPAFEAQRLRETLAWVPDRLPDYQNLYLPESEEFCRQQVVLPHPVLLADRKALELVVAAADKIKRHADEVLR